MAVLVFKDISFKEEKDKIRVTFLKIFYFYLEHAALELIGKFRIKEHSIEFINVSEHQAGKKFSFLLSKGFSELKNSVTNKPTIYIHQNSGIPLIGHVALGIVDRDTNVIELKPITGCNLDCIYCSVDEFKRPVDFVVEKDYLVAELKKLIQIKDCDDIEIHIGTQGEPLFYEPIEGLIADIAVLPQVKRISISTNGALLAEHKIDALIEAGLSQFNLSINALSQVLAKTIAGRPYDITRIKKMAEYIADKGKTSKVNLIITPVWVPGVNDSEIESIVKFALKIGAGRHGLALGFQNFLNYRFGKNPVKQKEMDEFYRELELLEQKYNTKLVFRSDCYHETKKLPKPFKKCDVIKAEIMLPGRLSGEMIAAAKNRLISIPKCSKYVGSLVKLKIIRTKDNIFVGELVR